MSEQDEVTFGLHAVKSLLEVDEPRVREILVQDERKDQRVKQLWDAAKNAGVAIKRVPKTAFYRHIERLDLKEARHQGVIAFCTPLKQYKENDLQDVLAAHESSAPLILVLDGVTDPHNLGACIRSADAAGVVCIIVPKDHSAPITSTAMKVACGAAEHVPVIPVTNLARTLKALKDQGFWVAGAAGETDDLIFDVDLTGPRVMIMGAEGDGMRRLTKEHCDQLVKIPMAGSVSSLNVSVATGICLFEIVRQNQQKKQR